MNLSAMYHHISNGTGDCLAEFLERAHDSSVIYCEQCARGRRRRLCDPAKMPFDVRAFCKCSICFWCRISHCDLWRAHSIHRSPVGQSHTKTHSSTDFDTDLLWRCSIASPSRRHRRCCSQHSPAAHKYYDGHMPRTLAFVRARDVHLMCSLCGGGLRNLLS